MTPRAPAMSPADRRSSIVAAALPLLRGKGLQVSTGEIAQAAGVAEGTLFRVFANKDEIIQAVIDDVMDPGQTIDELTTIDLTEPLPDRMTAIVGILHDRIADISFLMGILHASGVSHSRPSHPRAQHETHGARLRAAIAQVLMPDAQRLREAPEVTASLLRSIAFATAHPLISDGVVTDPRIVVDLFLHGLQVEPTTASRQPGATSSRAGDRPCSSA